MRFTLGLPIMRHPMGESFLTAEAIASASVAAEVAGFESVWLSEDPAP